MRSETSASLLMADRMALAIRWMALMVISITLVNRVNVNLGLNIALVLGTLWNISLTTISIMGYRLDYHPYVGVVGDTIIAALFFLFSGAMGGPFSAIGYYPLLTAAFYFGINGGLVQAGVNTVLQVVLSLFNITSLPLIGKIWPIALGYAASGVVLGYISRQVAIQIHNRNARPPKEPKETPREQQDKSSLERDRLQALYNITSTLNTSLNYERVLDLALDLSANALADPEEDGNLLVSAVLLYQSDMLHVGSARRFTTADLRVKLPGISGLIGQSVNSGNPGVSTSLEDDPELARIIAFHSCKTAYVFPLRSGLDVYGVLIFGHPREGYFDDQRRDILEIIGRQAKVSLVNAGLYSELKEEKERMMEIQEEARNKLARNLHDGPTQSVAAIAMRVNFARRLMDKDPKAAGKELFKIEDLARRTTKEIRHMLFTLRPLVLESAGLKAALESMAAKMKDTFEQNVTIEVDREVIEELEMGKQGVIFYIAEEAVNNARKHAEAANIWVRLTPTGDDLVLLEIEDNGVGFSVGAVDSGYENRGSLGMVNMRERTELISGALQINSEEGSGTKISVWIPLTEAAAEKIRHGV